MQAALAAFLISQGALAENEGICVSVKSSSPSILADIMTKIVAKPCPAPNAILVREKLGNSEKWDWVLSDDLFLTGYASRTLAIAEAYELCKSLRFELARGSK